MKLLILLVAGTLVGCSTTVPVQQKFPDAPAALKVKCPQELKTVADPTTLSKLTGTVSENYQTYHSCVNKVDGWIEWYDEQKKIFENVQKPKAPTQQ